MDALVGVASTNLTIEQATKILFRVSGRVSRRVPPEEEHQLPTLHADGPRRRHPHVTDDCLDVFRAQAWPAQKTTVSPKPPRQEVFLIRSPQIKALDFPLFVHFSSSSTI